ncbi:phosphoheptose isomerase [Candidatus Nitrosopumilus koreensis AR1]|uniref:Phosphoheptose isomerase n=1 Tax=Candidatus Nitrosopumilus koreensis AR1 TaxID=1229908 RepID=K0B532_9ARCH|nr:MULTISPECIES: SIS domain-containing protein [Nitrosopumilus]AFS80010.1 phosphoheptose isomerase [Candidatus Nitrosopumilus koreensis AR1]
MTTDKNFLIDFLDAQSTCISSLSKNVDQISQIVKILISARNSNKIIFTLGNGGSGSTASHFVSDLLKTALTKNQKRFKAISLVDNIPVILAWSNDVSYDEIFSEQLKNHLSKGDVVLAFSGSGRSKNIIKALKFAKKNGAICIGMTGSSGGLINNVCDVCIKIPSSDMLTIESQHLTLCHCITNAIRHKGKPVFKYE